MLSLIWVPPHTLLLKCSTLCLRTSDCLTSSWTDPMHFGLAATSPALYCSTPGPPSTVCSAPSWSRYSVIRQRWDLKRSLEGWWENDLLLNAGTQSWSFILLKKEAKTQAPLHVNAAEVEQWTLYVAANQHHRQPKCVITLHPGGESKIDEFPLERQAAHPAADKGKLQNSFFTVFMLRDYEAIIHPPPSTTHLCSQMGTQTAFHLVALLYNDNKETVLPCFGHKRATLRLDSSFKTHQITAFVQVNVRHLVLYISSAPSVGEKSYRLYSVVLSISFVFEISVWRIY